MITGVSRKTKGSQAPHHRHRGWRRRGTAVNNMILLQPHWLRVHRLQHRHAHRCNQRPRRARSSSASASPANLAPGRGLILGGAAAEEAIDDIPRIAAAARTWCSLPPSRWAAAPATGAAPVKSPGSRADRDPHRRRRHQAVPLRGRPPDAHRRGGDRGTAEIRRYADYHLEPKTCFRVANERTTFADAFKMADDVLHAGVRGVTDLMVMPGLINLDFADIRTADERDRARR